MLFNENINITYEISVTESCIYIRPDDFYYFYY